MHLWKARIFPILQVAGILYSAAFVNRNTIDQL